MNLKLQLKTNSAQRLQSLIFIAFTILSLLSLGLLTGILNQNFHNRLREDMRDRLRDIVALAALQIDTESHQALTAPEMEGNATYAKVQATLQRICESSPVIYYVYTMRTGPNGELIFVVDAETNPDEIAHLGEIYDSPGDVLAAEYRTLSQPVVEKNFYSDKWGTWLSGYAPFYTSDGQRAGIIGIDIEASQVQAHERRFLLTALIVFLAIIPLILALVWYASQRLSAIAQSTQEALHISEERLDLAMSVANDGMWDWILTTDETFFDTRYYTMAGYEPNEFPGTFAEWEKRVHPQDIDIAKAAIQAFVAEQTSQLDMEFRYQHKDGSWIWIRGRGKIVARDEHGKPLRIVGTHSDITERRKAQEELQLSTARTAQLEGIHKTVATLAHEINNPLTGIIGNLQVAREFRENNHMTGEILDETYNAAQRIRNTVIKLSELQEPTFKKYIGEQDIIDIQPKADDDQRD